MKYFYKYLVDAHLMFFSKYGVCSKIQMFGVRFNGIKILSHIPRYTTLE